ncbi:serine O-acetyltransferase [Winkia sp. UMB1185]|uniref:serine O-acetyltransferase EpsC n=1 Tax=Winkia sp. UMB1185 TaxID=3046324 RepID=UPI00255636D0|nr:serine O-acetyltransferase EpsC [Winkia sp. UMB1185]MDK7229340.1 serine O-acetyltransferase [Winkia sp. UMB1185]
MHTHPKGSLLALLREDVETAQKRDPAARSKVEVALTYPGVHALWGYRMAHSLWKKKHPLAARVISSLARVLTGVDIHPGATIGRRLFIDHAVGTVIGETAQVGEDCVLFHQVTSGGVSMTPGKRHPTIGDRVMIGSGVKVLGPIEVGSDSKIGANAVVTKPVPERTVAIGIPAKNSPLTRQENDEDLIIDPTLYI